MEIVYLEKRECYRYPESADSFSPSQRYPEYPFQKDTVSSQKNEVYDMVRTTLYGLGLDRENYNSTEWNPLKELLPPNGTVVLKPNWVRHYNEVGSMDALVTHPSVIRCMIDYCVIAGAGKIILGDAPVQGSDIHQFLNKQHYWELQQFYRSQNIEITIVDFRDLVVKVKHHVIVPSKEPRVGINELVELHLGALSKHEELSGDVVYATCGYPLDKIRTFHSLDNHRHSYSLSKIVLSADLILNLCKPKTHRFAGITGAQKNFVGMCPDKESLPHFRLGCPRKNGDETNKDTWYAKIQWKIYEWHLECCRKKYYIPAYFAAGITSILTRTNKQYHYSKGAWHGNDTIWRTILDLNLLIHYTDQNACLELDNPPRNILTIGDMVISGEKNGPLSPTDKPLGIILGSTNCAAFDAVFCKITGFEMDYIPTVRESCRDSRLLPGGVDLVRLYSNLSNLHDRILSDCVFPTEWRFEPHDFWKEVLERGNSSE